MDEFVHYLRKKRIANAKKRAYYAQWVRNLFRHIGKKPGHSIRDLEIKQFLSEISDSYQDWQVRQAQDAIRLYLYYQGQPKTTQVTKSYPHERLWSAAVDQMVATMRLKHPSLRTEKTFLAWMRQFYRHVRGVGPKDLDSQHVKNFLTYLAIERKVARATQNLAFNSV